MKTTIQCHTPKEFYDAISELYFRSVTFTADARDLTITLN